MNAQPLETGIALLGFSVPALVAPLLLGRVAHRFRPSTLITTGPLLAGTSCLVLAATYHTHAWTAMMPAFVLGGLGLGIGNLVSSQISLASAPPERTSTAAGLTNTAKQLGVATGVAVLGIPYAAYGLGTTLLAAATLGLLGAVPALVQADRSLGRRVKAER